MKNDAITSRDVDFAKWYTDIVKAAHLADYTSVKGCIAIEPNGYAIWEKIVSIMDKKFKELGHVNVQMPLLIPENLFNQEKEFKIERDDLEGQYHKIIEANIQRERERKKEQAKKKTNVRDYGKAGYEKKK